MANRKISALTQLTTSSIASGDKVPIVDASDTTDDPSTGTTKYFDGNDLFFKSVGGTVTALDVTGTAQMDGIRLDQAPTSGAVVLTHYFTINLNGTTYRVPCGTA